MDTEYFLHKISNKLALMDLGINRLEKKIDEENKPIVAKLVKASGEALELLAEFKEIYKKENNQ